MGTCFTKTEYVSGRQLNMNLRLNRCRSFAFSSTKDARFQDAEKPQLNDKDHDWRRNSKSAHGGKGFQCRYNRWICRRQESLWKDVSGDIETNSSIDPG